MYGPNAAVPRSHDRRTCSASSATPGRSGTVPLESHRKGDRSRASALTLRFVRSCSRPHDGDSRRSASSVAATEDVRVGRTSSVVSECARSESGARRVGDSRGGPTSTRSSSSRIAEDALSHTYVRWALVRAADQRKLRCHRRTMDAPRSHLRTWAHGRVAHGRSQESHGERRRVVGSAARQAAGW